jgi:hypothetical protein
LSSFILAKSNSRPLIFSFVDLSPNGGGLPLGAKNLGEFLPETIESFAFIFPILISKDSLLFLGAPNVF